MAVAKGVGKFIAVIGIVLIVIIGVIIVSQVAGGEPPVKSIVLKSIELRGNQDSVRRAQIISSLDTLIAEAEDPNLDEQWARMTECLANSCPDDAYFDIIFVTINDHQTDIKNADLLLNLLVVNRYWGTEDVVEFSKSLSEVDSQITELDNRKAKSSWEDVVKCNNECAEKDDYYFELIRTIAESS